MKSFFSIEEKGIKRFFTYDFQSTFKYHFFQSILLTFTLTLIKSNKNNTSPISITHSSFSIAILLLFNCKLLKFHKKASLLGNKRNFINKLIEWAVKRVHNIYMLLLLVGCNCNIFYSRAQDAYELWRLARLQRANHWKRIKCTRASLLFAAI